MKQIPEKTGSIWRRWDLHLHTPETKLACCYGDGSDETWHKYIEFLENSVVQAFGITDYYCCANYFKLVEKYQKQFPESKKVFFANIEFRISEPIKKEGDSPHLHVLFDNDPLKCSRQKIEKFLTILKTFKTDDNGVRISCSELKSGTDYTEATVSIKEVVQALKDVFGNSDAYLLVFPAKNDGIRNTDTKSPRKLLISDEIDKQCHAFYGDSSCSEYFLSDSRYESGESEAKPVFSGSDAHSFEDLNRLSGDETNFEATWIKSELTFRGLQQTIFEPKSRVYIGELPSVLARKKREATKFISKLNIDQISTYSGANGEWFKGVDISLNPELTAIIGNKGSGKSAIADIIGLLGNSRQSEHFSFLTDRKDSRKFKQRGYAENFHATLTWESGSETKIKLSDDVEPNKPEAIKYLPQNFFEKLTNDIEVEAFQREIEEVVFSHVETSDRMGKSTFHDLEEFKTLQSKNNTSSLKGKLRELNIEIVELEKQANQTFKQSLDEKLKIKMEELRVLEASRPTEVPKPEGETEEQKKIISKIADVIAIQRLLSTNLAEAIESLSIRKNRLQSLTSLQQGVDALGNYIVTEKAGLKTMCDDLGLDIDLILKHEIDVTTITSKIADVKAEIVAFEFDSKTVFSKETEFEKLSSVSDMQKAKELVDGWLKTLKFQLSAPQKRYQNYLQEITQLDAQKILLQGDDTDPKMDTVQYLKQQISYIENELKGKISAAYTKRTDICRSIFGSKKEVLEFYEELKSSVETKLAAVSAEDFNVTIEASFVPKLSFRESFLNYIKKNVQGPFKGLEDGKAKINSLISDIDWNEFSSLNAFANDLIKEMNVGDGIEIDKQVASVKEFYDFLFSFEYFEAKYELRLGGKNLNQLSPGEKGLLLLVFYLHLDKEKTPLVIDQPEDNLDNDSIFTVLARCIREAKKNRQVILVTHNPNLAVGADAEQIIYVKLEKHKDYKFIYESGAIENPLINEKIVKVLEGSKPAFVQRRLVYHI